MVSPVWSISIYLPNLSSHLICVEYQYEYAWVLCWSPLRLNRDGFQCTSFTCASRGDPNLVSLLNDNGSVVFQNDYHGPGVGPPNPESHPTLSEPYCAYAPNGTVEVNLSSLLPDLYWLVWICIPCAEGLSFLQGDLVYANFGEDSDFQLLNKSGVSCQGCIVIMRYGRIYRGKMVKFQSLCAKEILHFLGSFLDIL